MVAPKGEIDGGRLDRRPIPDPTTLTTQQIIREIGALKELVGTRLDAMDKAIDLLQKSADKQPTTTTVSQQTANLADLVTEKLRSVGTQFAERDTRTEQTSRDGKVAVDAALQAAKEAVAEQNRSTALAINKSEAAFTKQIDQIGTLIATTTKTSDDKIDDLKKRLTLIEGKEKGANEGIGMIGALVLGAVAVLGAGVSLVALTNSLNGP